jgi:hypothetical protein
MALTLFFFLAYYAFWQWLNKPTITNAVLTGACFGAALCSKFSAVIIPVGWLVQYVMFRYGSSPISQVIGKPARVTKPVIMPDFTKFVIHTGVVLLAAFVVILVVYRFNSANLFFDGLTRTLTRLGKGRSSFLAGTYSTTGWWYYFMIVFLIKTPVPMLLIIAGSTGVWLQRKFSPLAKQFFDLRSDPYLFLLVPVLLYFGIASVSKVQIGFRHILPVFPFLYVFCGSLVMIDMKNQWLKKSVIAISIILAGWNVYGCMKTHPWHLAYFNEFVGGPDNGYKYLTDSNVDWGQGLKQLGKYLKQNKITVPVFMCYFGVGDPHYYGIRYVPIGFINNLEHDERPGDALTARDLADIKQKTLFVVSVTNLQATYYGDKKIFDWLKKLDPVKLAAGSIFVYDLTGNKEAIISLQNLLKSVGYEGIL